MDLLFDYNSKNRIKYETCNKSRNLINIGICLNRKPLNLISLQIKGSALNHCKDAQTIDIRVS